MSCRGPRRMDAPDERFGSAGSSPARLAGDANHFHHGARRSVGAPDRAQCRRPRLSHKTFRRRGSCTARSESDVFLGAVPRFLGPVRPRLEAACFPLIYIYIERGGGNEQGKPSWNTNSSAMCLWTSATGIIKLTRNWPTLASDSTLGDGNSLCLRSPRRALLHQCDAELDFGPICKRRSVWNCQRVGTTKVNNHIYI